MIIPSQAVRIVIATKPVDFRKGHDGLAAVGERALGLDPHSGIIVVFRAKRGDRIKVLLWDGSGIVMSYKRLEQGTFAWPRIQDGVMRLTRAPETGAASPRSLKPASLTTSSPTPT